MIETLIRTATESPEGFTLTRDGEPLPEDFTGYLVGGVIPSYKVAAGTDLADAPGLVHWLAQAYECGAPFVGGWEHEGILYIDSVDSYPSEWWARRVARMRGELAYGYVLDGEYITSFDS